MDNDTRKKYLEIAYLKGKTYKIMNNLHLADINLYAVFVTWIIHTATGLLWFQNKLFGKEWSKLTGKELEPAKKCMAIKP